MILTMCCTLITAWLFVNIFLGRLLANSFLKPILTKDYSEHIHFSVKALLFRSCTRLSLGQIEQVMKIRLFIAFETVTPSPSLFAVWEEGKLRLSFTSGQMNVR